MKYDKFGTVRKVYVSTFQGHQPFVRSYRIEWLMAVLISMIVLSVNFDKALWTTLVELVCELYVIGNPHVSTFQNILLFTHTYYDKEVMVI